MIRKKLPKYFYGSGSLGLLYGFLDQSFILLCSYFISDLLENMMSAQWQDVRKTAFFIVCVLTISVIPKFSLMVLRSKCMVKDTEALREFLCESIIKGKVKIQNAGEMEVCMNRDVKTIADFFQKILPDAIIGGTSLVVLTILISMTDIRIGVVFLLLTLTQLLPIFVYEKWTRTVYNRTHADEEAYENWMLEGYNGIRTIKAYCMEKWYMDRFYKLNLAIVKSGKFAEQVGTIEHILFSMIESLLNYGSYWIVGFFVMFGGLSMEKVPVLIVLSKYLFSSIDSIFELRLQYFNYQEASKRFEVLNVKKIDFHAEKKVMLKAENLGKSYGDKQVLQQISFCVHMGEKILFKGENGSGKSVLLRTLMGLECIDDGKIICGIPKEKMVFCQQSDPNLEIVCGELLKALEQTEYVDVEKMKEHIKNFQLQDKMSKLVSELSAGERKKFYLSMALAYKGEIMILDEPTNHIDCESMQYLCAQLQKYRGTLLVCTHLSELGLAWDRRFGMKGGVFYEV